MSITYPIIRLLIGTETLEFAGDKVMNATLVTEINPLSIELSISTLDFTIHNTDSSFSMFGGTYYQLLSERVPVMAYESVDGAEIFLGQFYLSEWKNVSETEFQFRAVDVIGVLDTIDYDGNFYSTAQTLEVIIADLLEPVDVLYTIDDSLKLIELKGWNPPGSYREALQQVCFAAGACVVTSGYDRLQIVPIKIPDISYDVFIKDSEKLMSRSMDLQPLITNIELVSHTYAEGTSLETIFDGYLAAGSHKIVFEKPHFNITVSGPGYTAFTLGTEGGDSITTEGEDYIELGGEYIFGANCLFLDIDTAGSVVITGYPWVDSQKSYLFAETGVSEYTKKRTLKIDSATLISADIAQDALDRVVAYYRQRYTQDLTTTWSVAKLGDNIKTSAFISKMITAIVQKLEISLTGGYLSKLYVRGIEMPYIPPISSPIRTARAGVSFSGVDLTRNNGWREYDHT